MKLTKYTHACIVLEEQGQGLVIDPGVWSTDLPVLTNVAGIVITHNHMDHFDADKLSALLQANPDAKVFTTQEIADTLQGQSVTAVGEDTTVQAGPFELSFYGQMHALVYNNKPHTQNIGVLVNNNLYYPGDSFTKPGTPVKTLALPISGPWLKTNESIDFMLAIKPQLALSTHDALLSQYGEMITDNWYKPPATENGIAYKHLNPGQSTEV